MRKPMILAVLVLGLLLVGGYFFLLPREGVEEIAEELWAQQLAADPELQTRVLPGAVGDNPSWSYYWTSFDPRREVKTLKTAAKTIERLAALSPAEEQETLQFQRLTWHLAQASARAPFVYQSALQRAILDRPREMARFMALEHPINSREDADAYINRLLRMQSEFKALIKAVNACIAQGARPDSLMLLAGIELCKDLSVYSQAEAVFYHSFAYKAYQADPVELNEEEAVNYMKNIVRIIEREIQPAYSGYANFLNDLLPKALANIHQIADWDAYYLSRSREVLGETLNLDSLHGVALGEAEIWKKKSDSLAQTQALNLNRAFLAQLREKVEASRVIAQGLYEGKAIRLPKILAMPQILQSDFSSISYIPNSRDRVREATLWLSDSVGAYLSTVQLRLLSYQYAFPGEHMRTQLGRQAKKLAEWERHSSFPAYTKGWNLYALRLLDQKLSLFQHEPEMYAAYLRAEKWQTALFVVDTGLHLKGWTPEKAYQYLISLGIGAELSRAALRQVQIRPAHYGAAYVGATYLEEIKEKANRQQGLYFVIQDFHQQLLSLGVLPFSTLRQYMLSSVQEQD